MEKEEDVIFGENKTTDKEEEETIKTEPEPEKEKLNRRKSLSRRFSMKRNQWVRKFSVVKSKNKTENEKPEPKSAEIEECDPKSPSKVTINMVLENQPVTERNKSFIRSISFSRKIKKKSPSTEVNIYTDALNYQPYEISSNKNICQIFPFEAKPFDEPIVQFPLDSISVLYEGNKCRSFLVKINIPGPKPLQFIRNIFGFDQGTSFKIIVHEDSIDMFNDFLASMKKNALCSANSPLRKRPSLRLQKLKKSSAVEKNKEGQEINEKQITVKTNKNVKAEHVYAEISHPLEETNEDNFNSEISGKEKTASDCEEKYLSEDPDYCEITESEAKKGLKTEIKEEELNENGNTNIELEETSTNNKHRETKILDKDENDKEQEIIDLQSLPTEDDTRNYTEQITLAQELIQREEV